MSKAQWLRPCAFCNSVNFTLFDQPCIAWVQCSDCEAEGPPKDTAAEAIEAWNRAHVSSEQQAAQQDAETLTVEEILHIQETHVGGPCPAYPLDNSDWINFARAIEVRVIAARASNGGKA